MESWAAAKNLSVSVAVPPAPVRVPSQRPLAPSDVSVTSVANDKGDNEMILGAVHRSLGICLTAKENCRKPHGMFISSVFHEEKTSPICVTYKNRNKMGKLLPTN